jgi:hypothetical protein
MTYVEPGRNVWPQTRGEFLRAVFRQKGRIGSSPASTPPDPKATQLSETYDAPASELTFFGTATATLVPQIGSESQLSCPSAGEMKDSPCKL